MITDDPQDLGPWLTKNEAATYMRCSLASIDRWVRAGLVQRYTVGTLQAVRFRKADLDEMMVAKKAEESA